MSKVVRLDGLELLTKEQNKKSAKREKKKALKSEQPKPRRETSFIVHEGKLYEQIWRDGNSAFLEYNPEDGCLQEVARIEVENEIVEPIGGEDVERGAVKLPSGVAEYGSTASLLREIEGHIYRYLDVSDTYRRFAAYYVLLSWVYDRFHTLPYLRALGDTGCGKSRFLDVIGGLCYKPLSASGCVTPAPIYRMLKRWGGTLILDEADLKNSDEYNEVVTILNCGFERGRPVIRAMKDNPDKVQILPVYGPKVFATRRRFKDPALEARCLTEIMQETARTDIPAVLGKEFFEEQQELQNKLLLFRFRNYFAIDPEARVELDLQDVEPRLRQISSAFLALFANEPEVLADYRHFIWQHQRELVEQRAGTTTGQVVGKLLEALSADTIATVATYATPGETVLAISSADIAEKLGLKPQAVGQILKTLGVRTKQVKVHGQVRRCIIYDEARFEILRRRYIPREEDDQVADVASVAKVATVAGDNANAGDPKEDGRVAKVAEVAKVAGDNGDLEEVLI